MKKALKAFVNRLPYVRRLHQQSLNFNKNSCYPAGHYYSPIISVEDISKRSGEIWKVASPEKGISGVDLNVSKQLELLGEFPAYYNEMPFEAKRKDGLRYWFDNNYYSYTDGIVLY